MSIEMVIAAIKKMTFIVALDGPTVYKYYTFFIWKYKTDEMVSAQFQDGEKQHLGRAISFYILPRSTKERIRSP